MSKVPAAVLVGALLIVVAGGLYAYFKGASNGFGYVDYEQDKPVMLSTFSRCLEKIENIVYTAVF